MQEAFQQRAKPLTYFVIASGGKRAQCAAVKGALKHNHLRRRDTLGMSIASSEFNPCFVGLGARVAEEHILHARDVSQLIRNGLL